MQPSDSQSKAAAAPDKHLKEQCVSVHHANMRSSIQQAINNHVRIQVIVEGQSLLALRPAQQSLNHSEAATIVSSLSHSWFT